MKCNVILVLFLLFSSHVNPDTLSDFDRNKMNELMKQRGQQFGSYANSIETKTGIFGNKTKKDLLRSNEILIEIVRLDNKLMNYFNRKLDYKTYETVNYNFDKQDYEAKQKILLLANEKLEQSNSVLKQNLETTLLSKKRSVYLNYLLAIVCIAVISYHNLKKKKIKAGST